VNHRTRDGDTNSSSYLRLDPIAARHRAARVRAWATGVHQDDLRAKLIDYAGHLETRAKTFEQEAVRHEPPS
jgi:hypothetical protein